jgi:hypothetical protein
MPTSRNFAPGSRLVSVANCKIVRQNLHFQRSSAANFACRREARCLSFEDDSPPRRTACRCRPLLDGQRSGWASAGGSRLGRRQTRLPCCSGRCSLLDRSTCARSMAGKPSPHRPSISRLTSQLDPIPSVARRLRRAKFQPHHGRHRAVPLASKMPRARPDGRLRYNRTVFPSPPPTRHPHDELAPADAGTWSRACPSVWSEGHLPSSGWHRAAP